MEEQREAKTATSTTSEVKRMVINMNSILMCIALGGLAWMGNETVQNGKLLASIVAVNPERVATVNRLEKKVDDLSVVVTKSQESIYELRIKLADVSVKRIN